MNSKLLITKNSYQNHKIICYKILLLLIFPKIFVYDVNLIYINLNFVNWHEVNMVMNLMMIISI